VLRLRSDLFCDAQFFEFADEANRWINDMNSVVFDVRSGNLGAGLPNLGFAGALLKLNPDEFEWFGIHGRVYVRMWWARDLMISETIQGGTERQSRTERT
jgi:hypothetical protein